MSAVDTKSTEMRIPLPPEVATMIFALVYTDSKFHEKPEAVKAAFFELADLWRSSESSEDVKQSALDSLQEVLFPQLHNGELGVNLEESESMGAMHSLETKLEIEAMDHQEETFANRLRNLMDQKEITQTELAEKAGVGQPAISNILNRTCRPQRRTVEKLANALGVPSGQLWPNT
jgi:lambda repressor-like predicted transcriptional regulator